MHKILKGKNSILFYVSAGLISSVIILGMVFYAVKSQYIASERGVTFVLSSGNESGQSADDTLANGPGVELNQSQSKQADKTVEPIRYDQSKSQFICNLSCFYAAVDKTHALPSTYVPEIVATGQAGGGYLTYEANDALGKLIVDAAAVNIDIKITSAYRSYLTQEATFNRRVNIILANDSAKTLPQARSEANTSVALPGYSEHQLGTTVDLTVTDTSLPAYSARVKLYAFINANAHKYGFVVSYPEGKQGITGYISEPWHIRYVGVGLAEKMYNIGYLDAGDVYLAQFLRDKEFSE